MTTGEVAHQADAVGVVTVPALALAQQRVDRAGPLRTRGGGGTQRECGFLVRQGHVGTHATVDGKGLQRSGEALR
ncbi:hypothetical protein D3C71_1286550 [compost metagenome]